MHRQQLHSPKPGTFKGIGIVLALVLAMLLISVVTDLLRPAVGDMFAAILFWGLGVLLALWTMRRYVLSYTYELEANLLRITFAYGRYQRPMTEIYFNNIQNFGAPDDMKARYPGAKIHRATRPGDLPIMAVACRDNGSTALFHIQPDDQIRARLEEVARKNRK